MVWHPWQQYLTMHANPSASLFDKFLLVQIALTPQAQPQILLYVYPLSKTYQGLISCLNVI
uniref:Uncharacterized protein n=1 Tax=Solanum tuberosum TaxID=4113 RepID=M1CWY7_SOLTU